MKTRLLAGAALADFSEAYTKLSGLAVPMAYLERSRVYGFYIGKELIGGFILAKSIDGRLRTVELFAGDEQRDRLYRELQQNEQYLEVTCFWLSRKYRGKSKIRSLSWLILARKIVQEDRALVLYGTNNYGLAKLYAYPKTSTLLHRDEANGKTSFIFIATRKGFYNIFEIAFAGLMSKIKPKRTTIEIKTKLMEKIRSRMKTHADEMVSFSAYSQSYDILNDYTRPYAQLKQRIIEQITTAFPDQSKPLKILDVGSGTGNLAVELMQLYPNCSMTLVEPSEEMSKIARQKLRAWQCVEHITATFKALPEGTKYDVVLSVHALYLMGDYAQMIAKYRAFMQPDRGRLFVCDIGQRIKVNNWRFYLFRTMMMDHGIAKTIELFKAGKSTAKANAEIQRKQLSGEIWTHDLATFADHFSAHYEVLTQESCYRGVSNFVVCK